MSWVTTQRLLLCGLLAACSSAPTVVRAPTYEDVVMERVERSRSQPTFSLRHNPSDCACSPFEIRVGAGEVGGDGEARGAGSERRRVGEAWHRVELIGLDDTDPIVLRIRDHLARVEATGQPDRRHFVMEGRLEGRLGTCARGTALLSFAPSALLDEPGPGDSPESRKE